MRDTAQCALAACRTSGACIADGQCPTPPSSAPAAGTPTPAGEGPDATRCGLGHRHSTGEKARACDSAVADDMALPARVGRPGIPVEPSRGAIAPCDPDAPCETREHEPADYTADDIERDVLTDRAEHDVFVRRALRLLARAEAERDALAAEVELAAYELRISAASEVALRRAFRTSLRILDTALAALRAAPGARPTTTTTEPT